MLPDHKGMILEGENNTKNYNEITACKICFYIMLLKSLIKHVVRHHSMYYNPALSTKSYQMNPWTPGVKMFPMGCHPNTMRRLIAQKDWNRKDFVYYPL